ncbi:unnamed protein product [Malus baccata var. baccata]
MIWDTLAFNPDDMRYSCSGIACLQSKIHMLSTSPEIFDRMPVISAKLSVRVTEAATPYPDNIWCPSFISPTGPLTVRDSMMKNDMTAAVVARNLLTPKDNRLLSKRSDELAEIRGLKHDNKQLHLAHDYATNMNRKLDQMKESDSQVLLDHQRFVGLFQRHLLPSSSGAVPRNEAPNDQPLMPPPSRVLSSTEAPNDPPLVPSLSEALPTAETSPKQPL